MNNIRIIEDEVVTEKNGIIEKWSKKEISDVYIMYKNIKWYLIKVTINDDDNDDD